MGQSTRSVPRNSRWGRAVVVGGGYAGLVTARVLADHFTEVLVLERDALRSDSGVHPHVPQGYHAHALLARGGEALERLFPGLRDRLGDLGAPVFDYGERISFLLPTGYAPADPVGVSVQTCTRDELERRLRERVSALPQVRLLAATRCETVTASAPGRLDQVHYRTAKTTTDTTTDTATDTATEPGTDTDTGTDTGTGMDADTDAVTTVTADLVVDASGRSTSVDRWLSDAGLPASGKAVVKAKITYTSACYVRPPQDRQDFDIAYQMTFAPGVPRGGVVLAVEHHRWMCSLFGFDQHVPPTDDEGYLGFARTLGNPRIAEQIVSGTREGEIHRYTNPGNEWRLHHKNSRWPERLIAIGDALCVFNPVYGQGLTVAALEAELLGGLLRRRRAAESGLDGLSRAYHRATARLIQVPWTLASSSDLMWAPGGQPPAARFAHWYNQRVFALAVHEPDVWARFVRVLNMTAPPSLLFRPAVVAKVARHAIFRRGVEKRGARSTRG
ncbi:monooxygenase [Streptomyces sp. p1417]|uniref:Monooxygenase n=1 Tax=Streptomyces typhae TaxID=2681492 RepID=A0A6L6WTC7_9ACTN|nr:FAD-dependent monooxygenase [Streptomyces typhae]MVO85303.1 monooxygenase [Streptomyces typhae]